jgi:hypothetical protein
VNEPILQPSPSAPQQKASPPRFGHLDDARQYLRELAAACLEGAESSNPQVTKLALALIREQGVRPRRGGEVYCLTCANCSREIEISTRRPFQCPACKQSLRIEWGAN